MARLEQNRKASQQRQVTSAHDDNEEDGDVDGDSCDKGSNDDDASSRTWDDRRPSAFLQPKRPVFRLRSACDVVCLPSRPGQACCGAYGIRGSGSSAAGVSSQSDARFV